MYTTVTHHQTSQPNFRESTTMATINTTRSDYNMYAKNATTNANRFLRREVRSLNARPTTQLEKQSYRPVTQLE